MHSPNHSKIMNSQPPNWFLLLAAAAFLAPGARAQEQPERPPDWTQHLRLAMIIGFNIHADFKINAPLAVPGGAPGAPGAHGLDHLYDDGYVRRDQTGNAGGYTSYWGYRNASQYDASAQTMTYHSASSVSVNDGGGSSQDAPYTGLELAYGVDVAHLGRVPIGLEFGFGFLPISIKDTRSLSSVVTTTPYHFGVPSIVVPQAPFNGGPSGIGPQLFDSAAQSPDQTLSSTTSGSRTLDVNLFTLRLGPTVHWDLHPLWAVSGSAGGVFGWASGDYRFNETTAYSYGAALRNTGEFQKTQTVYGGYANAVLLFHAEKNGDIFLGAQLMSLRDASFSNEAHQAKLKLGAGLFLTAGVNWSF